MSTPIHLLIVEDDAETTAELKDALVAMHYRVTTASTLIEALGQYHSDRPDLALVDIVLQGQKDGIRFAQKIQESETAQCPLLFLTHSSDRETFDEARLTTPFSYLLKPFNPLELHYSIELALEKFYQPEGRAIPSNQAITSPDCWFIKKKDRIEKILPSDIEFVKVERRYCRIQVNGEQFVIQSSLKEMLTLLPSRQFVRIHRAYLANVAQIQTITPKDSTVQMHSGALLPLSRRYLEALRKKFRILV